MREPRLPVIAPALASACFGACFRLIGLPLWVAVVVGVVCFVYIFSTTP